MGLHGAQRMEDVGASGRGAFDAIVVPQKAFPIHLGKILTRSNGANGIAVQEERLFGLANAARSGRDARCG